MTFVRVRLLALFLVLSPCGGGCVSDAILFTTATQVGIEVNGLDNGKQTARIGYERAEFVSMPVRKKDGSLRSEAYSVVSAFHFDSGTILLSASGPQPTKIVQIFATGAAASVDTNGATVKAVSAAYQTLVLEDGEEVRKALGDQVSDDFQRLKNEVLELWLALEADPATKRAALDAINAKLQTQVAEDKATDTINDLTGEKAESLKALRDELAKIRGQQRPAPPPQPGDR